MVNKLVWAVGAVVIASAVWAALQSAAWRITSKLDTEGMEW